MSSVAHRYIFASPVRDRHGRRVVIAIAGKYQLNFPWLTASGVCRLCFGLGREGGGFTLNYKHGQGPIFSIVTGFSILNVLKGSAHSGEYKNTPEEFGWSGAPSLNICGDLEFSKRVLSLLWTAKDNNKT